MTSLAELIWPSVRFRIERTPEALLLHRAPDRSWWNVIVLPVAIVAIAKADYNTDGHGPIVQALVRYGVPLGLTALNLQLLFQQETVRVDGEALSIESRLFGWLRARRIPLREIERLEYDSDSTSSEGSTPTLRLKRAGRMLLITFAKGISEKQANEFLIAIRFQMPSEA